MCFTISGHWQVPYSGKSSPDSRKECVKRVWPIRNLFSNTVSRRYKHVFCLHVVVGLIACNLFPAQQFHTSCNSSNISFIRVTGEESADFAAASAFSLPRIPTCYVTQGHWKWYCSIDRIRVPIRPNYGPILYHFRDKATYWSKIAGHKWRRPIFSCLVFLLYRWFVYTRVRWSETSLS